MPSFAVNDCLGEMLHTGYQRLEVLLADFSDSNFLEYLALDVSAWRLLVCNIILHNIPQVLHWIDMWYVPGPYQHRDPVFSSGRLLSGYL